VVRKAKKIMRIMKSKAEAHFIAKNPVVKPAMVSGGGLAVREKLEMIVGRLGGLGQLGEKNIALNCEIADLIAFGDVHERCAIPTLANGRACRAFQRARKVIY
jgi:hypothetical protein